MLSKVEGKTSRIAVWESSLRFLFAVFNPNLHVIYFAVNQATACSRRLICLAFHRFGLKPV